MKYYIASRLENAETVKRVSAVLTAAGHTLTYDWTEHGSVQKENPERITQVAELERTGVYEADIIIIILPGGRGTHVELGLALAQRHRSEIVICAETDELFQQDERTCAFYWVEGVRRVTGTIDEWLAEIFRVTQGSFVIPDA